MASSCLSFGITILAPSGVLRLRWSSVTRKPVCQLCWVRHSSPSSSGLTPACFQNRRRVASAPALVSSFATVRQLTVRRRDGGTGGVLGAEGGGRREGAGGEADPGRGEARGASDGLAQERAAERGHVLKDMRRKAADSKFRHFLCRPCLISALCRDLHFLPLNFPARGSPPRDCLNQPGAASGA